VNEPLSVTDWQFRPAIIQETRWKGLGICSNTHSNNLRLADLRCRSNDAKIATSDASSDRPVSMIYGPNFRIGGIAQTLGPLKHAVTASQTGPAMKLELRSIDSGDLVLQQADASL
jgi:hypothetical protein